MIEYLYLVGAVICIGGQFSLSKLYQAKVGNSFFSSTLFTCVASAIGCLLLFAACGFKVAFNGFSVLLAGLQALCVALYTILGMRMMSVGSVAVYTMFIMMGGMVIPFFYGVIFLEEQITVWKIVGIVLLVVSLLLPVMKKGGQRSKNQALLIILGVIIFVLNGFVGVFTKMHQISYKAIPTMQFSFWQSGVATIITMLVLFAYVPIKKDRQFLKAETKKSLSLWWIALLYAAISRSGAVLQLFAAKTLEASILFPVTTGGTMFVSTVFGAIFFKEKVDVFLAIGLALAIASAVLFVL